jgi:hypothetical protein
VIAEAPPLSTEEVEADDPGGQKAWWWSLMPSNRETLPLYIVALVGMIAVPRVQASAFFINVISTIIIIIIIIIIIVIISWWWSLMPSNRETLPLYIVALVGMIAVPRVQASAHGHHNDYHDERAALAS